MSNELKIDNRKDILLLLLYSKGVTDFFNEPILGRTRLVKILFLFRKEALKNFTKNTEINSHNFYEFFSWDFGPFSQEIYDDINFFVLSGFIKTKGSQSEKISESYNEWKKWLVETNDEDFLLTEINDFYEEEIKLSEFGKTFAEKLYLTLSLNQRDLLTNFKSNLVSAPLQVILRYVYKVYPEMTEKSKIKGRL